MESQLEKLFDESLTATEKLRKWRTKNREHYNAYMREWRVKHPGYYAQRRTGKPQIRCKQCNTLFVRQSGPNKFCSVRCRNKTKYAKEDKAKVRTYQIQHREKNREHYNAYAKKYYPGYTLRKLTASPWSSLLKSAKRRAVVLRIAFDLDSAWASARWTNHCELTHIKFAPPEKRVGYKNRNFSPSIDKIDPNKGYTKDNCRIVLWAINAFKRDSSDEDMYRIARALIQHAPKKAATSPTVEQ